MEWKGMDGKKDIASPSASPPSKSTGNITTKGIILPVWFPQDVFEEFKKHREAIKSKMTERAEHLLINELERLKAAGHDPVACVNTAILNGWKSPYAPKVENKAFAAKPQKLDNFADRNYGEGGLL